jgi:hypothetical protein
VARRAVHAMESRERVSAWVIDDTGFLKQGRESPGVQRQYTGSAGKVTNCQVAVSLTLCTPTEHVPVDMQLYLPESWTSDRARCDKAKIPSEMMFRPKWKMALEKPDRANKEPGHHECLDAELHGDWLVACKPSRIASRIRRAGCSIG